MVNLLLFDRFLARVFAGADAPFVLKGGTRMLAFIPTARATVDIDLPSRYACDMIHASRYERLLPWSIRSSGRAFDSVKAVSAADEDCSAEYISR
jgi:hypothetical protein